MRKPGLLTLVLLTSWMGAFAQTTTKPPVHHTVKPVAARVDPVASAMKAVTVALKPDEDIRATYLFTGGISDQADTTYSKITTVGCVLSYTVTVDQSATDKSGSHSITTHVMDLKNAVPIQAVPDPGLYWRNPKLDMPHSQPFYGFLLKFTIPQPRQLDYTGFNAKGPVPEKHDSTPQITTGFYSKTLEDSVHLKDAINNAIQVCGGAANVALPEPVAPPPAPRPAPPPPPPPATAEETIEWLNAQISAHSEDEVNVTSDQLAYSHYLTTGANVHYTKITVQWQRVKSISMYCESICRVTFTGDLEECKKTEAEVNGSPSDWDCAPARSVEVKFYSRAGAQRTQNALTRLALLGGAHLTNNNTF